MSGLNSVGAIGSGVGGGALTLNNVAIHPGTYAGWLDDDHLFFANGTDGWIGALYEISTGTITNVGVPMNVGFAGGGRWASWGGGGIGLVTSWGFDQPAAGLLGMGQAGTLGYKPVYQSLGPTVALEVDGSQWTITAGHAYDLYFPGPRQAIWQEQNVLKVAGLPVPVQIGSAWRPYAFLANSRWWILYYSSVAGIVLHPIDNASLGYVIVPPGVSAWHSARLLASGLIKVALFNSESEQAGTMLPPVTINPGVDAMTPLTPPPPSVVVPKVGKKVLQAWLSDVDTPAPENCTCRINFRAGPNDNLIRAADGTPLAAFIDREDSIAGIEQSLAAQRTLTPTLPCVVYWPRGFWGQHCSAEIYGVEAYQHVNESPATLQTIVAGEIEQHQRVWIVAQGYNSNPGNTPDTAHVVPVIAQLLIDHPNADGCLPFSAGTRTGGWTDLDAPTHQAWRDLFTSITGVPRVDPITPPIPPDPPKTPFPPAHPLGVHMSTYLKITAPINHSQPIASHYVGVDPNAPTKVYYNRPAPNPDNPGAWEEVVCTQHGTNQPFDILFKIANVQLSVDQYGTLTTRPAGAFGTDEQFYCTTQPDGSNLVYRFQDGVLVPLELVIEVH